MDQNINKPIVSIILPVYNGAKYLKQAIESVLQQTFTNFELIIINDGSTDNSLEIINSFNDPRIKKINQENKGLIKTLNIGLNLSEGKYIARIDSDDVWSDPTKIEKQVNYTLDNPDCVLVGTWAKVIDENSEEISRLTYPDNDKKIRSNILIKNYFIHPSVLFTKEICLKAGFFNEEEKYAEDYGLWLRMGQFGTFANLPEYLMSYRIHKTSVTRQNNLIQSKNSLNIIRKNKTFYPNYFLGYLKWKIKILLVSIKYFS